MNLYDSRSIDVGENCLVGGSSRSGCGIVAEGGAGSGTFLWTTCSFGRRNAGSVSAAAYRVQGNRILDPNIPNGSGNVGIYVWNLFPPVPAPGHSITNNYLSNLLPAGRFNDYWEGGNCGSITLSGNRWCDEARRFLLPEALRLPPPLIPPRAFRDAEKSSISRLSRRYTTT